MYKGWRKLSPGQILLMSRKPSDSSVNKIIDSTIHKELDSVIGQFIKILTDTKPILTVFKTAHTS